MTLKYTALSKLIPWMKFSTRPIQISIGQEVILPSSSCKSLGVMSDKHLEMNAQVKSICQSTHFHIRNIREIRHLLPSSAAAQLVHSLVTLHLYYCNTPPHRLPDCRIKPLQRVQNIAGEGRFSLFLPRWHWWHPQVPSLAASETADTF